MKIYNMRISRSIGISTAALLSIVFYIAINIVLNLSQNVIDPTGETYSEVYGIAQFVIVSVYWIIINYFYFSQPGNSKLGTVIVYLLFMLLPIIILTITTIVLIDYYPITDFVYSWNITTWIIGPTLFWFLPYSYLYYIFGYAISFGLFLGICLIYNICIISIGIVLGLIRRSFVEEKNAALRKNRITQSTVTIDSEKNAELVTNIDDASSPQKQPVDLSDENVPSHIRDMNETAIINEEIDRINNQDTYIIEEDENNE